MIGNVDAADLLQRRLDRAVGERFLRGLRGLVGRLGLLDQILEILVSFGNFVSSRFSSVEALGRANQSSPMSESSSRTPKKTVTLMPVTRLFQRRRFCCCRRFA